MYKYVLVFLFLCYCSLMSQNTFEVEIDRIENSYNRIAFSCLEVDDGYLLTSFIEVVEFTDTGNYLTDDVMLTKIDKKGNIVWDRKYKTLRTHELHVEIYKTNNKDEFIFSYIRFSDTISAVINKIDGDGNIIWGKELFGMQYINSFTELNNTDYLMTIPINDGGNKILRYTSDGVLISEYKIKKKNNVYIENIKIINDYIFLFGIGGNESLGSFIDKYDVNYNLIYTIEIDARKTKMNGVKSIFNKNDEYFFITRGEELYSFDINTGDYKKLNDDFYDKRRKVDQFLYTADNNYLLSYDWTNYETVNKYDEDFNLLWRKEFYLGEFLSFKDMIETSDGGLFLYGWFNPKSTEDSPFLLPGQLYVLKTDCEGNKEWNSDACYVPTIKSTTVFPNPFQDKLKIQIPSMKDTDNYSIELYNKLGQEVLFQKLTNKITALNTQKFSKALYFYIIKNDNKTIDRGKVLKN